MIRTLTLFVALVPAVAQAQSLDGFERVLLPGYSLVSVPGVGGAYFYTTYLGAYSDHGFRYWPGYAPDGTRDQFVERESGAQPIILPYTKSHSMPPRVAFVKPHDDGSIAFDLKVTVVRPGEERRQTVGTLPIVREKDFITGDSQMLLVPFHYWQSERDSGIGPAPRSEVTFRHRVSIYDLDLRGDVEVIVRVFHLVGVDESVVKLTERDGDDPSFPYYASVVIKPKCFTLPGAVCLSYDGRVEIEPVDPSSRYWAMTGSTNNRTHDFAITVARPVGGV